MGELKALYTVPELARLVGLGTEAMRRMLDSAGVEYVMSGTRPYVPLSEVVEKVGGLGESVKLLARLQRISLDADT